MREEGEGTSKDWETFKFLHQELNISDDVHDPFGNNLLERVIITMADNSIKYGITEWWAHNMGKFDGLLILEEGLRQNFKMVGIPAAGRIIRLDIYVPMASKEVRVRLLDSYAVVQSRLEEALQSFAVPTKKAFKSEDYEQDMRAMPIAQLREGCFADCRGLYELLDLVDKQVTGWGGKLKSTFSSCAMSVVKAKLADVGRAIPSHDRHQDFNEVGRKAYYGGRVEVLNHAPWWVHPTKKPLLTFDVNSSYPAAMRETLPWELYGRAKRAGNDLLYDGQWEGVGYATVHVPSAMPLPPLPFRPPEGGVFFPTGEWSAWFPFNELRYADSIGCDVSLKEAIVYTKAEPFKDFIDEVYEYKRTSTGAARMFAKLMLNGCYGKFGMKPERDILRIFASENEGLDYAMATGATKMHSWRVLSCKTFKWAPTTHYALASYITAGARIRLHKALLQSDLPAYCDTDSVHCSAYHGTTSDLLGALKLEGTYERARYFAPKLYMLADSKDTHQVSKGFPVRCSTCAKKKEKEREKNCPKCAQIFNTIIVGKEVKTGRMQLARTQLRKGGSAAYVEQLKRWNGRSMKRYAFSTGHTRPWSVEELSEGAHLEMMSPLYVPTKERES